LAKVILLAGGGGHTGYAYALAHYLVNKCDLEIIVPEEDKLSYDRLVKFAPIRKLIKPRGPTTSTGPFVVGLIKSFTKSSSMFKSKCIMISTGSNFCMPPSAIAWLRRSPLINIESSVRFTRSSKSARMLARFSNIIALQWPEQRELFPQGEVFGPMLARPEREPFDGGYVLVTGGTYGHRTLFQTLDETKLENVTLQAGPYYNDEYVKNHPTWRVLDYSAKFYELIAGAEVVVTHFGETIIDAALVYHKPTVIAMNPDWTRTAGLKDATILAEKVNAVLLGELTPDSLLNAVEEARKRKPPKLDSGAARLSQRIIEMAERF